MDSSSVRRATHAGSWYSGNPKLLGEEIGSLLSKSNKNHNANNLKAIIVPHAGYRYSAPTAAKAFININPDNYDRVVVLGPSHHEYFQGCGLSPFAYFGTPFGNIKIDTDMNKKLLSFKGFFTLEGEVDECEHSIEMEIPFIKYIFNTKEFKLVTIMVGHTDLSMHRQFAQGLAELFEDNKTLFVISSDFCHWGYRFGFTYYDKKFSDIWESTKNLDEMALKIIGNFDPQELSDYFKKYKNTICGRNAISIMVCLIENVKKDKKFSFECAGYAQSENVTSMNGSSVSYAAGVLFSE